MSHTITCDPRNFEWDSIAITNGNGKVISRPLPALIIVQRTINEVVLRLIEKDTGLVFHKGTFGYTATPYNHAQISTLLVRYNFETRYFDNNEFKNTILLKFSTEDSWKTETLCYECVKRNGLPHSGLNPEAVLRIKSAS